MLVEECPGLEVLGVLSYGGRGLDRTGMTWRVTAASASYVRTWRVEDRHGGHGSEWNAKIGSDTAVSVSPDGAWTVQPWLDQMRYVVARHG